MDTQRQLEKMRQDWDDRARVNAEYYVATGNDKWTAEDFFASGDVTVQNFVLTDMQNICQGRNPKSMTVLEIGCGVGRLTKSLAGIFGEVYAVDISSEMVARARANLQGVPNAHIYQNNGQDLSVLPPVSIDFAFSCIVFQHIPSTWIIENYIAEVGKRIRPSGLFKFQAQGAPIEEQPDDTWVGVGISEDQAREIAARTGFEMRYSRGAGTQEYWLWFFRKG